MKVTVVITIFNCSINELEVTLKSVCNQKNDDFEIIFADDCSKIDYSFIINKLMKNYNISYKYIRNKVNVGTVKNLLNGVYHSNGEFIKPLGCGDTFYSESSLSIFAENFEEFDVVYGKMQGFITYKNEEKNTKYKNPLYIKPFFKDNQSKLNSLIVLGDHLSGAGLMYKRDILIKYLEKMKNKIIYVEDFVPMFVLLDGGCLKIINQKLIRYSIGTGISTAKKTDDRILNDAKVFDDFCVNEYSLNPVIIKYIKYLDANSIDSKFLKFLKKIIIEPR